MIREATYDDFEQILLMSQDFCNSAKLPYDAKSCIDFLNLAIESPDHGLFVAEENNELSGMLFAIAVPWVTDRNFVYTSELCWWVKPNYRGSSTAIRLIKRYMEWSKNIGAKRIQMSSLEHMDGERIGKIYESLGFTCFERDYILDL